MRRLEKKTGKTHPLLDGCPPLAPELEWLQAAFLRLHRRRQHSESGLQPITHQELENFARNVIEVPPSTIPIVVRILEATDDAVLFDFYERQRAEREEKEQQRPRK